MFFFDLICCLWKQFAGGRACLPGLNIVFSILIICIFNIFKADFRHATVRFDGTALSAKVRMSAYFKFCHHCL